MGETIHNKMLWQCRERDFAVRCTSAGESHFRHVVGTVSHEDHYEYAVRSKRLFIVSYNEVVIILFPRGGANTTGW